MKKNRFKLTSGASELQECIQSFADRLDVMALNYAFALRCTKLVEGHALKAVADLILASLRVTVDLPSHIAQHHSYRQHGVCRVGISVVSNSA